MLKIKDFFYYYKTMKIKSLAVIAGLFIIKISLWSQNPNSNLNPNLKVMPPAPGTGIYSYHGKRLMELKNERDFFICAIKIIQLEDNNTCFDVFFTSEIDPMSIKADSILIIPSENQNQDKDEWINPREMTEEEKKLREGPPPKRPPLSPRPPKIPPEGEDFPTIINNSDFPFNYQFMKNSRGIRFIVSNTEENFNLIVQNIKSWQGLEIAPLKLENLNINSRYLYLRRENVWKKF